MKKILNILMILALTVVYTSCSNEVDDVFDKSSALRMQEALKNYKTILTTPANGWLMEYYGNTDYGGYNMFVKFSDNDMVEVANEVYGAGKTATSHYKLEQSGGVILSFDEFNEVFHFFSDPDNIFGIGNKGKGMEGDLEFRIISATADSVVMTGKKHGSKIVMTPVKADTDWDSYLEKVNQAESDMAFASYFFNVGDEVADVSASYHMLTFTYTTEDGELVTVDAPYILRPDGYHLYEPVTILGKTITDFTYKGGEDYLFTTNDADAIMKGYVMPLSEAFLTGNWYISYANMCDAMKGYWDFAAPGHLAKEGETIGYAYYSSGSLFISSGNYLSGFDMAPEALSDTQVKLTLTGWAGSSAQQGNANYYWNSLSDDGTYYFRSFILPLPGTYNMKANDTRNPTMIMLTDVDDPTYYYVLTKQAYPATQGMK